MEYICLIVLAPDFMTRMCKKVAQDFHRAVSKVFDRVKSVALWSANIRKLAKDHKGYGSAAKNMTDGTNAKRSLETKMTLQSINNSNRRRNGNLVKLTGNI